MAQTSKESQIAITMYLVFSDGSEVLTIYDEDTSSFVVKNESLLGVDGSLDILRTMQGDIRISSVEVIDKTRRRTFMHLNLDESDLDDVSAGSETSGTPCTSECSLAEDSDSVSDMDDFTDEEPVDEGDGSETSMAGHGLEEEPSYDSEYSELSDEEELTDHYGGPIDEITLMHLQQYGSW